MAGKYPVTATDDQKAALKAMADSSDRGEADRARSILLTLGGWTSARIAEAFGVREDTVRLWRSEFMSGGIAALWASVAPGPVPLKAQAALRVAEKRSRTSRDVSRITGAQGLLARVRICRRPTRPCPGRSTARSGR